MGRRRNKSRIFGNFGCLVKKSGSIFQKTFAAQDETTSLKQADEEEEVEVGFVDGLFEMYKLRCDIAKARAELLEDSARFTYNHITHQTKKTGVGQNQKDGSVTYCLRIFDSATRNKEMCFKKKIR